MLFYFFTVRLRCTWHATESKTVSSASKIWQLVKKGLESGHLRLLRWILFFEHTEYWVWFVFPPPQHTYIYTYREGQSIQQILWCVVSVLQELSKGETHVARVRCVAWSPDSSRFVTAALDSNVILWDDVNESYKSRPSIKGELNMLKFSGFDDCCVGKIQSAFSSVGRKRE